MADVKEKAPVAVKEPMVELYNQGGTRHTTSKGDFHPNSSIVVPESEAKRLTSYSYIVPLSKISKIATGNNDALKAENAKLQGQVKDLTAQVEALQGKVTEFLGASKMAELKELQEKHAPEKK